MQISLAQTVANGRSASFGPTTRKVGKPKTKGNPIIISHSSDNKNNAINVVIKTDKNVKVKS